ncbi:class I SAM-dependent methyltransferase [Serratia microhaemolytica]|uniref:class I SAM-dependent methyltransferase n=1 Tax=Serratia microhaemolytica TaxID=2675110 RepID=UPI000FDDB164|nr:class I SAM-dependent methyltransferase [Serratia microhaemolytica]
MLKSCATINVVGDYQIQSGVCCVLHNRISGVSGSMDRIAEQIMIALGVGRVLDVGSGEGHLVTSLLRKGLDACGVDALSDVVVRCNKRLLNRFFQGEVLQLPFGDGSFQTVVSLGCLEQLAPNDIPMALKEIYRVTNRYVFLQVATASQQGADCHLTIEGRAWWETKCFEAGFRKHPVYYKVNPYESLNEDGWQIIIVLEKIPEDALQNYPLSTLAIERDLHMDMLREAGERSDAHLARYLWAEKFVRQGDRVLDAACGLGYGSYTLAELSKAKIITGVDGSDYAINYAHQNFTPLSSKLEFFSGYLPECLERYPDGYFDLIVSFETLEHVEHPQELLTEFHRLLSPGGRIVVSVPNDWSDETGEDPNPFHLHVYTLDKLRAQIKQHFIPEALVQQIASGCKTTSAWDSWQRMSRVLRRVPINIDHPPPSEWWLMVAMKDPVEHSLPYRESIYGYSTPPDNLLQFERDYKNPWLVRSLLEFHFRASDNSVLCQIAHRVIEKEGDAVSTDKGAALAVLGYQMLTNDLISYAEVQRFIEQLEPYFSAPRQSAHLQRFYVSLAYLKAKLLVKIGKFDTALSTFKLVANADLSVFSPTLGSKVIDAAFEAGLLAMGQGDIDAARANWTLGVERAYTLLSSDIKEFIGNIDYPHEFPTIVAVEFLDSAVRCIKALRITAENSYIPHTRLYELTRENWKGMLDERTKALHATEAMVRERDRVIAEQGKMLEERWAIMQSMESMVRERDIALDSQAKILEERWAIMQSMESMVRERDIALGSQAKILEERWSIMQSMEDIITERDEIIAAEGGRLAQRKVSIRQALIMLFAAVKLSLWCRITRIFGRS